MGDFVVSASAKKQKNKTRVPARKCKAVEVSEKEAAAVSTFITAMDANREQRTSRFTATMDAKKEQWASHADSKATKELQAAKEAALEAAQAEEDGAMFLPQVSQALERLASEAEFRPPSLEVINADVFPTDEPALDSTDARVEQVKVLDEATKVESTTQEAVGEGAVADAWCEEWDMLLEDLRSMGFSDEVANRQAVIQSEGELKRALRTLVEGERAA